MSEPARETWEITSVSEWLERRRHDITASRLPALFGLHPYISLPQLADIMRGTTGTGTSSVPDSPAMRRGRILEPAVAAALAEERPDLPPLVKASTYHRVPEWRLGCTPDYWCGDDGLVQCKTVSSQQWHDKWHGKMPLAYVLQTLCEAIVTGRSWALLACLEVSPSYPLHVVEVPRHGAAERRILDAVAHWWTEFDAGRIAGTAPSAELAAALDDGSYKDLSTDNYLCAALPERERLKAEIGSAEKQVAEIDATLKAAMGAVSSAWLPGYSITWKSQHRRETVIPARDIRVLRVRAVDEESPMPQNEVATIPRPGAAHSIADIEKLADAVARSRMFGITTKEQALVLMAISQAEGRHPAEAARDYNIIQGKPAKTSEAMMRDFIHAGGRVEWHALTDDIADATFSHPAGGTIRIIWDAARAAKAGLASKDMWRKFPRQMMRSRCVSEGVRTVCPMATSGFYVPEEVRDMPAILPAASASDATADLDQFAADAERILARDILAEAREVAVGGTVLFREFWAGLSAGERDGIRQHLPEFQTDAEVADKFAAKRARAAADNPDDPFGLPPSPPPEHLMPTEPPPPVDDTPRPDLEIAMPLKGGKPDPRTWALALFAPKVRRCTASNELADLLGANEHHLEEARATLAPAVRAELEQVIAEQWQKLPG